VADCHAVDEEGTKAYMRDGASFDLALKFSHSIWMRTSPCRQVPTHDLNHTHLDPACIYGADRCDVIGLAALRATRAHDPQHFHSAFIRRSIVARSRLATSIRCAVACPSDSSNSGTPWSRNPTRDRWAQWSTMT
jgi:hypothetical protein